MPEGFGAQEGAAACPARSTFPWPGPAAGRSSDRRHERPRLSTCSWRTRMLHVREINTTEASEGAGWVRLDRFGPNAARESMKEGRRKVAVERPRLGCARRPGGGRQSQRGGSDRGLGGGQCAQLRFHRQILDRHGVTFPRTKTWKESNDPDKEAKLDRIEEVIMNFSDRTFAFDEFGPLAIHPIGGCCWAKVRKPQRNRANYPKHCGVRRFHACYSLGDDTLWGVVRKKKGIDNSLEAIKSCRRARPDGQIYVILDNLSAHKGKKIKAWCAKNNVELCSRRPTAVGRTRSSATSGRCVISC